MSEKIEIVLGSSSPRRRDLLSKVGLTYEVVRPETIEQRKEGESPKDYVERNAREKGEWVVKSVGDNPVVISADTIVVLGEQILEKPKSEAEAKRMLSSLSGNTHTVITGVCIARGAKTRVFSSTTDVVIKNLSSTEIDNYIKSGEPMDKAGAYAAQGIGSYMVKKLVGSYANVVGLPIAEVVEILESDFQVSLW
jgi:septum formation protein